MGVRDVRKILQTSFFGAWVILRTNERLLGLFAWILILALAVGGPRAALITFGVGLLGLWLISVLLTAATWKMAHDLDA